MRRRFRRPRSSLLSSIGPPIMDALSPVTAGLSPRCPRCPRFSAHSLMRAGAGARAQGRLNFFKDIRDIADRPLLSLDLRCPRSEIHRGHLVSSWTEQFSISSAAGKKNARGGFAARGSESWPMD